MPPRTPPFDLTQIEIANLCANIENWSLAESSVARSLRDTLQEAIMENKLHSSIANKMMHRIMPATIRAFHEHVYDTDVELGVRTKGKLLDYRGYEGIWTLRLKDVTIELQDGEPNPMEGYDPDAKKTNLKGKKKAADPYDLTAEDEDEDDTGANSTPKSSSTALMLANPTPAQAKHAREANLTQIAAGTKRSHEEMTTGSSASATAKYPSNAMAIWGTAGKKGSYTIVVPKLTIRMYPSGYQQHYQSSPQNGRGALTRKFVDWEQKRMIDKGIRKERVPRGPNKPRKKKKTEVKVDARDLAEDEPDEN